MSEEEKVQLDAVDDEQMQSDTDESQDDFKAEKSAEEYAKKWREAAAQAKKERQEKAAYKARLETIENEKLESQGKYKEMWEKDRKELDAIKSAAINGSKKAYLKDELISLGLNPSVTEKALRLADLDSIEVDKETFKPDMEQISYEARKMREELPMLFTKKFSPPKDGTPGTSKVEKKSVRNMSNEELDAIYAEALKSL